MIALIDYDGGNFKSIINILKRSNIKYLLTNRRKEILKCKNIILPGVSNFDYCIKKLKFLDSNFFITFLLSIFIKNFLNFIIVFKYFLLIKTLT